MTSPHEPKKNGNGPSTQSDRSAHEQVHPHGRAARSAAVAHARRRRHFWWTTGTLATIVILIGAVVVLNGGGSSVHASHNGLTETGEYNSMGMPVVTTPGRATGQATAGGVHVTAANWELGRVPLLVAVRPTWTLHNEGTAAVTIGEPKPVVKQGCCPGALTLGTRTLAPGGSTTLTFELSMHPGMDGPHDIDVAVPVSDGTTSSTLTVNVTGDFEA